MFIHQIYHVYLYITINFILQNITLLLLIAYFLMVYNLLLLSNFHVLRILVFMTIQI
jgi:hypothetical protein